MNAYYRVTQELKRLLLADEDINTVTKGNPSKMDMNKKNIFPLGHINVINVTPANTTLTFQVAVFAMSLRNTEKKIETDKFIGNDNEDDNLNSMMYVLVKLYLKLLKMGDDFVVTAVQPFEPFTEARGNVMDGWMMLIDVELPIEEVGAC